MVYQNFGTNNDDKKKYFQVQLKFRKVHYFSSRMLRTSENDQIVKL